MVNFGIIILTLTVSQLKMYIHISIWVFFFLLRVLFLMQSYNRGLKAFSVTFPPTYIHAYIFFIIPLSQFYSMGAKSGKFFFHQNGSKEGNRIQIEERISKY